MINNMNNSIKRIATALLVSTVCASVAHAVTVLETTGSIYTGTNYDAGLPGTGNDGTIAIDATIPDGSPVFAAGTYSITHSAGALTAVDEFNLRVNSGGALTWNMTGGTVSARYFLANSGAGTVTFNMSGGSIVLANVSGTQQVGAANGAIFNLSGSGVIDAANSTEAVLLTGGSTIDIATDWTGSWTHGFYDGNANAWRDLFVATSITYNGGAIDGTTFDTTFVVTDNGQTLALVPEPSSAVMVLFGGLGALAMRRRRG